MTDAKRKTPVIVKILKTLKQLPKRGGATKPSLHLSHTTQSVKADLKGSGTIEAMIHQTHPLS